MDGGSLLVDAFAQNSDLPTAPQHSPEAVSRTGDPKERRTGDGNGAPSVVSAGLSNAQSGSTKLQTPQQAEL